MTDDSQALADLKRQHHAHRAPVDARARAVARFAASRPGSMTWPAWGVAAAIVCAVVLLPVVIRDTEVPIEPNYGAASLSLNQVGLPPRPDLQMITMWSSSELSVTTLPFPIPNLNQLSVARIEVKETI